MRPARVAGSARNGRVGHREPVPGRAGGTDIHPEDQMPFGSTRTIELQEVRVESGAASKAQPGPRTSVVGYIRVSSRDQAESGLGLAAQRAAIETECVKRGWTLISIEADEGKSGKSIKNRPGLALGHADGRMLLSVYA